MSYSFGLVLSSSYCLFEDVTMLYILAVFCFSFELLLCLSIEILLWFSLLLDLWFRLSCTYYEVLS